MTTSLGYCLYLYITHSLVLLRRLGCNQEVTKRCRLSWLTNSALVYAQMRVKDCGVSANEYSCAHGAQINFGDLTPYLTYGYNM
jgi:hypothetical protein